MADTKSEMQQEERYRMLSDEIEVLHSIFCRKDEFLVNGNPMDARVEALCRDLVNGQTNNIVLSVDISCQVQGAPAQRIRLNLTLYQNYPFSLPEISLSSPHMTRKQINKIHKQLMEYIEAECCDSEPIVLRLTSWLQENISTSIQQHVKLQHDEGKTEEIGDNIGKKLIAVLRFDHMRARKKYLKFISRWMKELDLNGCILFFGKEIIGIAEGTKYGISNYLKYLRTSTVDVDSAGRPCKERMLDLLCEIEKTDQQRNMNGFNVLDCSSLDEFQEAFHQLGLDTVYQKYIKH